MYLNNNILILAATNYKSDKTVAFLDRIQSIIFIDVPEEQKEYKYKRSKIGPEIDELYVETIKTAIKKLPITCTSRNLASLLDAAKDNFYNTISSMKS